MGFVAALVFSMGPDSGSRWVLTLRTLQLAAAATCSAGWLQLLGSSPGQSPQDRSPQDSGRADRRAKTNRSPGPPMAGELWWTLAVSPGPWPFHSDRWCAVRSPIASAW